MTYKPVSREDFLAAREALIAEIVGKMPDTHRHSLLPFGRGNPEWALLDVPGAPKLPAALRRQQNLDKLAPRDAQRWSPDLRKYWASLPSLEI
jgi:hypothetical protein